MHISQKQFHEKGISSALRALSKNGRKASEREYAYFKLSEALEKAFDNGWVFAGVSDDMHAHLERKDTTPECKNLKQHYREITASLIDFRNADAEKRKKICQTLTNALSAALADGYALKSIFIDDWGFESSILREMS